MRKRRTMPAVFGRLAVPQQRPSSAHVYSLGLCSLKPPSRSPAPASLLLKPRPGYGLRISCTVLPCCSVVLTSIRPSLSCLHQATVLHPDQLTADGEGDDPETRGRSL